MARPETGGKGLPCVVAFLPDKEKSTYIKLFSIIKEKVGDVSELATIVHDFEQAVFTATSTVFGNSVQQRGCRYHFNAAIWRKLGELGLQSLFHKEYILTMAHELMKINS